LAQKRTSFLVVTECALTVSRIRRAFSKCFMSEIRYPILYTQHVDSFPLSRIPRVTHLVFFYRARNARLDAQSETLKNVNTRPTLRFLSPLLLSFSFVFYRLSARPSNRDLISSKKSRVQLPASSGDMPRRLIKVGQDEISRYAFSITLLPPSRSYLGETKEEPRLVHPSIRRTRLRSRSLPSTGAVCR